MPQSLQSLLPAELFSYALVFSRIGATVFMLPGFGESYVSPRIRLLLALMITVLITPVLADKLPALPASPFDLMVLVGTESIVGVSEHESACLLAMLWEHSRREEFTMRWKWRANDLAFWDNMAFQHYAVRDYQGNRVLQKGYVKGETPVGPCAG